ncbi:hypothetical protein EVAR_6430_1 [Eumeta japonica]|uniref:Uncharacterized protein n=1 Tax=Eumeta variegata TaxID=151549 RepID=A0A4C1TCL1_EUMVA|nr:hypothetical protein EVAR_6430_1 [Eumeta japonica]
MHARTCVRGLCARAMHSGSAKGGGFLERVHRVGGSGGTYKNDNASRDGCFYGFIFNNFIFFYWSSGPGNSWQEMKILVQRLCCIKLRRISVVNKVRQTSLPKEKQLNCVTGEQRVDRALALKSFTMAQRGSAPVDRCHITMTTSGRTAITYSPRHGTDGF